MKQKGRGLLLLSVALLLIILIMNSGHPAAATDPRLPSFYGHAQLVGPLELVMNVSPAVAQPGDNLSLNLLLTNHTNAPATPQISLAIPTGLSLDMRLPTGTTYNVQGNSLGWQPLVPAGSQSQLVLSLHVDVANIAQAEQALTAVLHDGQREEALSVAYWVGVPPQASLTANPQQVAVGQPVQLLAQVNGSGPFSQQWNLGDGRTLNIENPVVSYALPGTYQVTLQVANPLTVATVDTWVMVVPQPAAQFTLDDLTPGINQTVSFVSQSGGQPPLRYYWDFGDGAFAETAAPVHAYPAAGTYLVRLIIENDFGRSEVSLPVVVGSPPVADMILNPATVSVGTPVNGQAFGDQTVVVYQWDMGDGRTLQGDLINHVYQQPGEYYVSMSAGNDYGNTIVSRWIHVDPGFLSLFLPMIYSNSVVASVPGGSTAGGLELLPTGTTPVEVTRFSLEANPDIERLSQVEQLYWYINEARRQFDLPPLGYGYELSLAAQHHTGDMAAVPGTMHVGSDGSHPSGRLFRFGYTGGYAGEATAWGFAHAYEAVAFWVNSPPHRTIILGQAATDVGVGYTVNLEAPNVWYWTAEFGSSWLPPVQQEILPTPTPGLSNSLITLLGPEAGVSLPSGTVLDLTWNWPLALEADQQFVVYLVNANGATPIGFASSPVEGTRYALRLAGDWAFPTGDYQWQVKLESRSAVAILAESELRPLTFLERATGTPTPTPTLPPLPSATPTNTPTPAPTDNPLPTPLPISTDVPTTTPTDVPPTPITPEPPADMPTATPTPPPPTNTPEPPPATATPPMPPTPTPPETGG